MSITTYRRPGHAPEGFRQFIHSQPRPQLLHLSTDGKRTRCGRQIAADWLEPTYTQRTKCRTCWLSR